MTVQTSSSSREDMVVGYFAEGAHAYRAINELIDEGFTAAGIGAAFRTPRAQWEQATVGEMKSVRELTERNPATAGSVGGPASRDQAVTPAGLAPGSGSAFPGAPSKPGPIPGSDIPVSLGQDSPRTVNAGSGPGASPSGVLAGKGDLKEMWVQQLKNLFGSSEATGSNTAETAKNRNTALTSDQKFGTGEGTLGLIPEHEYSESTWEGSFTGMGLGPEQARSLSGELGRGGAVVAVSAGERASLAEAIFERNRGRVRFEFAASSVTRPADRESPVQVYGSMQSYYRAGEEPRRMAS